MSLKGVQRGCTLFVCLARSNRKLLGAILVGVLSGVPAPPGRFLSECWWSCWQVFHQEVFFCNSSGAFSAWCSTGKSLFGILVESFPVKATLRNKHFLFLVAASGRKGTTKNLKEEFLVEAPGQGAPLRIQKEIFLVERAGPRGSTNE